MAKTYLFILDNSGKRKATFLTGVHGKDLDALREKATAEYPDDTQLVGIGEEYFNEFAQGKIYVNGEFVPEPPYVPPLADVQAAKIAELKSIRDAKELEPVAYNGSSFDFDTKSYDRINAAIIALDGGGSIGWTTADNTVVTVTAADLRGVIAAAAVRSNQLHITYRELKAAVMDCTTNEEVEEIHWPEA